MKRKGCGIVVVDDAREKREGENERREKDRRTVTSSPPVDQTRSSEAVEV